MTMGVRARVIDAHNQTKISQGLRGRNQSRDLLKLRIMGVLVHRIIRVMMMMRLHKKMTLRKKMRTWSTTEITSLHNPNSSEAIRNRTNYM
jgi:hypothetical protein